MNPAQFAPHEDLATYPQTLPADLELLSRTFLRPEHHASQDAPFSGRPIAAFVPTVADMYPNGIVQDIQAQKGTFVEVKGYDQQMEGRSRPTFFRGVATVVTKLFNAVQVSFPVRLYSIGLYTFCTLGIDAFDHSRLVHTLAKRISNKHLSYVE